MSARQLRTIALVGAFVAPVLVVAQGPVASASETDRVWTTGLGSDGQLGTGGTSSRSSFAEVTSLNGVDEVAGGREHVVALIDGEVWTWGDGSKGATGLGSTADRTTPARVTNVIPTGVPAGTTVVNVSTGHYHSLALLSNGQIRAWGFNSMGQLGDGTTAKRTSPVTVRNITNAVDIIAGRDMSYALLADGTVRAWGGGANGELGNGTTTAKQTLPVTVTGLSNITALAGGRNHGLALRSDGEVFAWGLNEAGRLGDGTTTRRTTPVQVVNLDNVTAIAAGADHSVAIVAGNVYTWGEGSRGQLGSGTTTDRTRPLEVSQAGGIPDIGFIGCGRDTTYAIGTNGQLWDWGHNDNGQLGYGMTSTRQTTPRMVVGISDAVEAHGGRGYTVLRRDNP